MVSIFVNSAPACNYIKLYKSEICDRKGPQVKKKQKNNRNGSHAAPCFLRLTVNSNAFYQLNNHYIDFSVLNGNAKCH